jgi:hypothetical protein
MLLEGVTVNYVCAITYGGRFCATARGGVCLATARGGVFCHLRVAAFVWPLRVAAARNRPTGFLHLPPGRRYALHP